MSSRGSPPSRTFCSARLRARSWGRFAVGLGGWLWLCGTALLANRLDQVVQQMPASERAALLALPVLSPEGLRAIEAATSPKRLEASTRELLSLGSLSIGARPVDAEGMAPIHHYLRRRLAALPDVEILGEILTSVHAPVELHQLQESPPAAVPSQLALPASSLGPAETVRVYPLWPNGPMPVLTPPAGLTGPLVDAGQGDWSELKGKPLRGSIALLNFGAGRTFERLFSLGAVAIIVVEDDFLNNENAEGLFSHTPLPIPRFYVDRATGARLRAWAAQPSAPPVTVQGGHLWERRTARTLVAWLPPTAPKRITLTPETTLSLLATAEGSSLAELRAANTLASDQLTAGQELRVPGRRETVRVRPDELWQRLAQLYGADPRELARHNQADGSTEPPAGTVVEIPNSLDANALVAPMESMSVVPDAPHGAKVAATLAATLAIFEHLATAPNVLRRKGTLLILTDGDTLGGQASRTAAEYALRLEGRLASRLGLDQHATLERDRAAARWFADPQTELPPRVATYLAEQWVLGRLERARITLAEQRIVQVLQTQQREARPEVVAAAREQAAALKVEMDAVAALRTRTLDDRARPAVERLRRLREELLLPEAAPRWQRYGIAFADLVAAYQRELDASERTVAYDDNNLAVLQALRQRIAHPTQTDRRIVGWYLDLTLDSHAVGIVNAPNTIGNLRQAWGANLTGNALEGRLRNVVALATITAAWPEEWSLLTAQERNDYPMFPAKAPATYDEFWLAAGLVLYPLVARNDRLETLDTPADSLARLGPAHWRNLSEQARTALVIARVGVEHPPDTLGSNRLAAPEFSRAIGRTVRFDVRSGIDAREPVPDVYVYQPLTPAMGDLSNSNAHRGFRRGVLTVSAPNGTFRMPLETVKYNGTAPIFAYQLSRTEGFFRRIHTEGQVGTQEQKPQLEYVPGFEIEKNLVMVDVYPLVIFPGPDPRLYRAMGGGPRNRIPMKLQDAILDGPSRDFAVDNPFPDYTERDLESVVLYMPAGRRVRAIVQDGLEYRMLLTGKLNEEGRGQGFRIGPGPNGETNLSIPTTPPFIARNMLELADHRLKIYESFGITNRVLRDSVERARTRLAESDAALARYDWQEGLGAAREAWGMLIKAYPTILGLGREAVFSVILLMAFLAPGAFLLERLAIGAKGIIGQLAGTVAIFALGTAFLSYFHPAFRIAVSPFIVVIAFTMILMALIVLIIAYQRFDVLLRRMRARGGEVESEEISLVSSLGTAFSLGVSNLKKRMARTTLTTVTVAVLTFSIVAFVAVSGRDALFRTPVELDRFVETGEVEPLAPAFEGILARAPAWGQFNPTTADAWQIEFGARFPMVRRGHYIQAEGGNNADREGNNQVRIVYRGRTTILTGVMAYEPAERDFSGLHRAVQHEAWFQPGDRDRLILPAAAAAQLGLTEADIYTPTGELHPAAELPVVLMLGREWRVAGLLDPTLANRIRDINGKSLAMVDYLRSSLNPSTVGTLEEEGRSYHLPWEQLAIVPIAAMSDISGRLRSVALKFPEGFDASELFADMARRLRTAFWVYQDGEASFVTTREQTDVAGLAKIILPVILCVLIVMNTMMGTVDERKGEVGMLGAIGLSPGQISFLLLSEATVYSILGIVFGVYGGLFFANVVPWVNAAGIPFLNELSFNFTSVASMTLAVGTGLVVLLATLLPAARAAKMAAPSGMAHWELPPPQADGSIVFALPFTLTKGNAIGMLAFLRQFLNNHLDATSSDFNCRGIAQRTEDGGQALALACEMWLAPYDLDVSQRLLIRIGPTGDAGVFAATLTLQRLSGSEEAWLRTNYSFLELVRRQFLLWRNLPPAVRTQYVGKGGVAVREMLGLPPAPPPAAPSPTPS